MGSEVSNKPAFDPNWSFQPAVTSATQNFNEAMQMPLQARDSSNLSEAFSGPYPERPGVADCAFYNRTGSCAFGLNCHFNHPPNRKQVPQTCELPEKVGQLECQFYLKGTCKFGTLCKFKHCNDKAGSAGQAEFNFLGLPIRQGEKECPFYMRIGSCKYGVACKFNHPEPTEEGMASPVSSFPVDATTRSSSASSFEMPYSPAHLSRPSPRIPHAPGAHLQEHTVNMHAMNPSPPQGIPPMRGWNIDNHGSANTLSSSEGKLPIGVSFMNTQTEDLTGLQAVTKRDVFPERPGQPECQHYLRTGECKFGAACRYHHPKRTDHPSSCMPGQMGIPLPSGAVRSFPSSEEKRYYPGVDFRNTAVQCNNLAEINKQFFPPRTAPFSSETMPPPIMQTQASATQKQTFPERPGQFECPHFLRTGECRFGVMCQYNHPKEWFAKSSESMFNPTGPPVHYVPVAPMSSSEEKQHTAGIGLLNGTKQTADLAVGSLPSVLTSAESICSAAKTIPTPQPWEFATKKETFPERPGQPDCAHYLKTGDCSFGAACRYNHPKEIIEQCMLSEMGLPLRPGKPTCVFYSRCGICKFGPRCKFDHPITGHTSNRSVPLNSELPVDPYSSCTSATDMQASSASSLSSQRCQRLT